MVKSVGKRFLSVALVIVMVLSLMPVIQMPAGAATSLSGLGDSDIGLSYTGSGGYAWQATADSIAGTANGKQEGCTSSATTTNLTITNKRSDAATLSFDYTISAGGGTVKVAGSAVTANGSYSGQVAAGKSITISLQSAKAIASATTIQITNLRLVSAAENSVTFAPAANGSYTVDGAAVTADTTKSGNTFSVTATPASGYVFMGWYDQTKDAYLSMTAATTLNVGHAATVTAKFKKTAEPVFHANGKLYTDLGAAVSSGATEIRLVSNGTITGQYTIPANVTLIIPFNEAMSLVKDNNINYYLQNGTTNTKAFRTLTMANGAKLTVKGTLCVESCAELNSKGQAGPYGLIQMNPGSAIEMQSGAKLYALGYIKGTGNLTINSGAAVYENMFFADYPGSASTAGGIAGEGAFPMLRFTARNVEAPMKLMSGATEKVHANVYGTRAGYYSIWVDLVGNTQSSMFQTSGAVTKSYQGSKQIFQVDGDLSINGMSITLGSYSMNTSDTSGVPIPYNFTINVNSGTTTCNENIIFSKGSVTTIAQGAKLSIKSGKNVYVLDASDDVQTINVSDDAVLDVNGEVEVSGGLFTSTNKARIISSQKTGVITLKSNAPSASEINEKGASNAVKQVAVVPASLLNGDGTYTETEGSAAGTVFSYCATHDKWEQGQIYTITFDANDGEGTMDTQRTCADGPVALNVNTFTREGYIFDGWKDSSGTAYTDQQEVTFTADTTLYAQWKQTYTVTWVNWDGTVLATESVNAGTEVNAAEAYTGETPTRASDEYSYSFSGWDQESAVVNSDVTFIAQFTPIADQYFTVKLFYRVENTDEYALTLKNPILATKSARLTAENEHTVNGTTYYFSHWEFDGVEYPAHTVTIHPGQGGPESDPFVVDAYAVYTTEPKTEFPSFVKIVKDQATGTNRVVTLSYSLTDGGLVQENGVGFKVKLGDTQIGDAYSKTTLQNTSTGTYTVTIKNATAGINVIGYVKYQKNGADAITLETK